METYEIVRFYSPMNGGQNKVLKSGLSLEDAKEHCNDPTTRKEGVYFDGYREE